jgi:uncharacterized membrane protein
MPNVHPLIIHFPLALLSVSLLFDVVGAFMRKDEITRVAWWCQISGSLGLLATVVSGLQAESTVSIPQEAGQVLQTHKELAFLSVTIFSILLFWRISTKSRITQRLRLLFWSLYVGGVLIMWIGAWYGGEMVYQFGVGIRSLMP